MAVTWNVGRTVAKMTAAADTITEDLYINAIRWVGAAAAADVAVVSSYPNGTGDTIFHSVAVAAGGESAHYFDRLHVKGLQVETLGSGTIYVDLA